MLLSLTLSSCTGDKVLLPASNVQGYTQKIDNLAKETAKEFPKTKPNMDGIQGITPKINDEVKGLLEEKANWEKEKEGLIEEIDELNSKQNSMVKYIILGGLSITGVFFLVFGIARGGKDNTFIGGICCVISISLGLYWEWVGLFGIVVFVILLVAGIVMWWEGKGIKKEVFRNYG